jgi:hypothetical protein
VLVVPVASAPVVPAPPGLPLEPLGGAELDVDEPGVADPDVLAEADPDETALGLEFLAGVVGGQLVPVAAAVFLLFVALTLAFAEAVVAGLVEPVPVAVAVALASVAVELPLEVTLLAGVLLVPLLVLPLAGVVAELAGVAFGADFVPLAAADDEEEELGTHGGAFTLLWPTELAV